jgi:O-antigen ligase
MAGRFSLWIKVAAGASLPLILYTILATDARLGAVGFFMSVLLYLLIWSFIQWRHVKGSLLGPAVFLAYPVIFCAFMAATFAIQRLRLIVWGGGSTTYSNQARIDQLHSGIPKILNRPVGYGAGQGADELGYVNLAGTMTIDNYYLLIALEYGILGFILYYGAIALVIYHAAKHSLLREPESREHTFLIPVAISLSVFFIIKSIFSQMGNHTLQFMMIGMAAALIFRMKHGDAAGLPPSRSYMPPERQSIVQPTSLSMPRAK